MIHNLGLKNSLVSQFVSELRDVNIQNDRMRFRRNLERLGEIIAYEISQKLKWEDVEVTTPLGIAVCKRLAQQPVLATILRAGMPLHQGLLNYFDQADNAFIGAYRKHEKDGTFTIQMTYHTSPQITGRVLIVSDPMLATGASLAGTLLKLSKEGKPSHIHIVAAIAAAEGIAHVKNNISNCTIWTGAVDEELTAKAYIVPGLGDAGDLAYGEKSQD
jgi:uracil phosphoribosyltransferase